MRLTVNFAKNPIFLWNCKLTRLLKLTEMNRRNLFSLIIIFFAGSLFGQVTFQPKQESSFDSKGIVYNKELSFDLQFLQTNGWSFAMNSGKIKTYYLTPFYHISIGELKHIKEYRQQSLESLGGSFGNNQSFILGKQNNLFAVRAGYGQKRYFSEKAKIKGLAVGISYEAGPTLGLLKPYYLDLRYPSDSGGSDVFRAQKYNEENHDIFLERTRIGGAAGLGKGFSEIAIRPGFHAMASAHFDWGAFDEFVKAMEAGFMIDFFFGDTDIMVETEGVENRPFFMNVFINLQLGKRW